MHPSPVSCPRIYYAQGGEAECGVFLEKGPPLEPQCQQMTVTYSRKATQKENDLTPQPRAQREWEKIEREGSAAGGRGDNKIKMKRGKDGEMKRWKETKTNTSNWKQVNDLRMLQEKRTKNMSATSLNTLGYLSLNIVF